jgi:hypothetical protein
MTYFSFCVDSYANVGANDSDCVHLDYWIDSAQEFGTTVRHRSLAQQLGTEVWHNS